MPSDAVFFGASLPRGISDFRHRRRLERLQIGEYKCTRPGSTAFGSVEKPPSFVRIRNRVLNGTDVEARAILCD